MTPYSHAQRVVAVFDGRRGLFDGEQPNSIATTAFGTDPGCLAWDDMRLQFETSLQAMRAAVSRYVLQQRWHSAEGVR